MIGKLNKVLKNHWQFYLIFLTTAFLFTLRLGRDMLWDWDECIYAGYATAMKSSHEWLTNMWNGQNIFDKSPLYTWILQLPLLLSSHEFVLRLPSVLASLALLVMVYKLAHRLCNKEVAILATLLTLCGDVFIVYSIRISTDVFFTLFVLSAVYTWILSRENKKYLYLSGAFFGLGLMVKGLGIIPYLGTLFLSIFLTEDKIKKRFFDYVQVVVAFLVVGLPWHLYALLTHQKDFIQMYVIDNFYKRSTYPVEFHRERFWFYAVMILKEFRPWILFAIVPVIAGVKDFKQLIKKHKEKLIIFLFIILPFISITRVHTKIAWYAIPLYPFIAIFLAYGISLFITLIEKRTQKKHKDYVHTFLLIVFITLLSIDAFKFIRNETHLFKSKRETNLNQDVILETRKYPDQTINYLVSEGERGAKIILPPEETLTYTWWYGGNSCAVYYSHKKVNYFYETDLFEDALKNQKGLFLVKNQDEKYVGTRQILFRNVEYTLFR